MYHFEPTSIEELLNAVFGPIPAEEYMKGLDLLHRLQHGQLDDKLNLLINGDNGISSEEFRSEILTGFFASYDAALKEHGITIVRDTPFLYYFNLLNHLVMLPGYDKPEELIDCFDVYPDNVEGLLAALEIVGLENSDSYIDYIVFIEEVFVINLKNLLHSLKSNELVAEEISDEYLNAKQRLSLVPSNILLKSSIYQKCLDGYGIGYQLDKENHDMLISVIRETDDVRHHMDEARVFLLASGLPQSKLMKYLSYIVENLLDERATIILMDLTTVEYF